MEGLLFIGIVVSVIVLYVLLTHMDSNYKGDKAPPDDNN